MTPYELAQHLAAAVGASDSVLEQLRQLHIRQWRLEDQTRAKTATAQHIAETKQEIDASNAQRHRLINAIDGAVTITSEKPTRYYAETVGELCDRLLIVDLKRRALPGEAAIDALSQHLRLSVEQLITDIHSGQAALPQRVGAKVYNGDREAGL